MENQQPQLDLTDPQLAEQMLRRKLVDAGRLKAALDYQASVGGQLTDVLLKLGLVRKQDLDMFLRRLAAGEDFTWTDADEKVPVPLPVGVEKLRLHGKLIEKVPAELVERYGILFFFPPPGTRAILLSSDPAISPRGVKKLQELLCVEICPVVMTPEDRDRFLPEERRGQHGAPSRSSSTAACEGAGRPSEVASAPTSSPDTSGATSSPGATGEATSADGVSPDAASEVGSPSDGPSEDAAEVSACEGPREETTQKSADAGRAAESPDLVAKETTAALDHLCDDAGLGFLALVQLLVKKGLVRVDELEVEVELLRRRAFAPSRESRELQSMG